MIVLGTNVLSEAMKPAPAAPVAAWIARHQAEDLFTTAVTEAEILFGVAILPDGRRKQTLDAAAYSVLGLFSGRILPFDAQIAAIASSRGMSLATRNTRDFDRIDVTLIDPWQG